MRNACLCSWWIAGAALLWVASAPAAAVTLLSDTRYVTQVYYVCDPGCRYEGDAALTAQEVYGQDFAPEVFLLSNATDRTWMDLYSVLDASAGLSMYGYSSAWTGQDIAWGSSILRIEFQVTEPSTYALEAVLRASNLAGGNAEAQVMLSFDELLPFGEGERSVAWSSIQLFSFGTTPREVEQSVPRSGVLTPGRYRFRVDSSAEDLGSSRIDYTLDIQPSPIPEPSTASLLAGALVGLALARRRAA